MMSVQCDWLAPWTLGSRVFDRPSIVDFRGMTVVYFFTVGDGTGEDGVLGDGGGTGVGAGAGGGAVAGGVTG
jgi:hypothetical protein